MGRRKSSKSGGASTHLLRKEKAAISKKGDNKEDDNNSESEESENFIAFDNNNNNNDSDDNEEEIFNLDIGDDDEEEEGGEEDSGASSDESEDDMDDDDNELNNLVSNLPDDIRNKILRKKQTDNSDIVSGESDSDSESGADWGKKKQVYWTGDTADLEIGQEVEDAEDEEAAAEELYESKVKRMKASDFFDDINRDSNTDGSSGSEEEEENVGQMLQRSSASNSNDKGSNRKITKKLAALSNKSSSVMTMGDLELAALNSNSMESTVEVEKLSKDVSKLTKQQKLDLLNRNSPELLGIVTELKDLIGDLQKRILPLKEFITKDTYTIEDDIVEYTEVKYQLLLSYCTNVLFYLYMKAQGKSVQSHPVMKQMLKLRFVMEKMRPIDAKLRHQIDRLLQYSRMDTEELEKLKSNTGLFLRPNPAAMLTNNSDKKDDKISDGSNSDSDGSEDMSDNDNNNNTALYKAPKRTAVPYKENETAEEKKVQRLEKQRNKLRRSELMQTLREEFGTAPEEAASSGLGLKSGDLLKLQEEEEERLNFEEDRFVRTTLSRKEKKSIKRRTAAATRLDNFDDIGDTIVGDLEEISRLAESHSGPAVPEISQDNDSYDSDTNEQNGSNTTNALQKAVKALMQSEEPSKTGRKKRVSLMEENLRSHETKERKRRRAPMDSDDVAVNIDDDETNMYDNILEDFSSKKKSYLKQKKDHYTAEPRYGGVEVNVEDSDKRAATYEIMKNRGLTPHRKKANRNPRVKKREMYDKAVIRRKGQVRDVITGAAGSYGGELTGIKSNIARSRKIGV